ncbi:hypothetical protein SDC9_147865 [bioreactor metagenome]|uniref:Uncharacterized protein n=1 Tax=bioreactor metagenome TaxID=1076179 RepID=A0A645EHP4_9ZZZZ
MRLRHAGDILRGAGGHDLSPAEPTFGTHIDHPVGGLDDVEVVLDDHHGVTAVDQPAEHVEESADVLEMQAGGRLVEYVDRIAGGAPLQFGRQLDPLCLTPRQCRRGLPQPHVSEPHLDQRLQMPRDGRDRGEELRGLFDGHVQHLGDGLALVAHLERLAVVASAVTDLAGHVDIGEEVHLDADRAVTHAVLAAPALDVEAEAPGLIAARLGLRGLAEQGADLVEDPGVGGRIGAR